MELTSKERLMRIFKGGDIDRPALKLWGLQPGGRFLHPDYIPVYNMGIEKTDIFYEVFMPFNIYKAETKIETRQIDELWQDNITTIKTPSGNLRSVYRSSKIGAPGYETEYLFKSEDDIKKFLRLAAEESEPDPAEYFKAENILKDRGIVHIGIGHAAFILHQFCGSENLAYFSVDCRDLVTEAIKRFSDLRYKFVQKILKTGVKAVFSWVGPELFIPPLMSRDDFEEFVFLFDKPLCDLIHENGGYVWMHCHGKTAAFIDRFIEMGIDVINPLEPAPNGDAELQKISRKYAGKIGLEGNIEIQELLNSDEERVRGLIYDCVKAGSESKRFILCPSAGYMEYPEPNGNYINNLSTYINYGYECVNKFKYR